MRTIWPFIRLLCLLLFTSPFFCACTEQSGQSYQLIRPDPSPFSLDYSIEKINIPIDSVSPNTFISPQFKQLDRQSYIFSYNPNRHSLDVYDTKRQAFLPPVLLEREGPNGIESVNSYFVHKWDSIFILTDQYLCLIDSLGQVLHTYHTHLPPEGKYVLSSVQSMGRFDIYYYAPRQQIFAFYHPTFIPLNQAAYYEAPIEASLDLRSEQISPLPVYYAPLYRQGNTYFGYLNMPMRTPTDSLFIYTFPADPNLYVYDRLSGNQRAYGGKSKYAPEPPKSLPPNEERSEKKMQHMIESTMYFNVLYDPQRRLYYRFHFPAVDFHRQDGTYNGFEDKKPVLMVFDDQFRLVQEVEMPDYNFDAIFSFVSTEGLWIPASQNEQEDFISYDIWQFRLLKE